MPRPPPVGERRIHVAIADDQFARLQSGRHAVGKVLHARRRVQQRFTFVRHFAVFSVEQHAADGFGDLSSARFARENMRQSVFNK